MLIKAGPTVTSFLHLPFGLGGPGSGCRTGVWMCP